MADFWSKQHSSRYVLTQKVSVTSGSKTGSAFDVQTRQVRVAANQHCHIRFFSTNETSACTTSDAYVPQFAEFYYTVTPGQFVSVIQASSDGNITAGNGTVWISEMG